MTDPETTLKRFGYSLTLFSLVTFYWSLTVGTKSVAYLGGIIGGMGIGAMWVRRFMREVRASD